MADGDSIFGLGDPGSYATDNGADAGTVPDVENLVPVYPAESLGNFLPSPSSSPTMEDDLFNDFISSEENGDITSTPTSSLAGGLNLNASGLLTDLGGIGQSLANAFIVNPQNAATSEAQALANAQISSLTSSNLFSYLLIGLVIWLVFGLFERK